jgi:hypothetical protein
VKRLLAVESRPSEPWSMSGEEGKGRERIYGGNR